jgi:hypothetical protein
MYIPDSMYNELLYTCLFFIKNDRHLELATEKGARFRAGTYHRPLRNT